MTLRGCLNYIVSFRPVWAVVYDSVSKSKTRRERERSGGRKGRREGRREREREGEIEREVDFSTLAKKNYSESLLILKRAFHLSTLETAVAPPRYQYLL